MAWWLFIFPSVPNCVERCLVNSPYTRRVKLPDGREVDQPDPVSTWAYLAQQQYPWPVANNRLINPTPHILTGRASGQGNPEIFCLQVAVPAVSAQMVNAGAPVGAPYGNAGGPLSPPPVAEPRPAQMPQVAVPISRDKMYEELPGAALPGKPDDAMFGADEMGGTYADIDSFGREEVRPQNLVRVAAPNPKNPQG